MTKNYLLSILCFATIVLGVYALTPKRFRYIVLLVASVIAIFFYSKFMGFFVILTALSTYLCGLGIFKLEEKTAPLLRDLDKPTRKKKRKVLQKKKYAIMAVAVVVNLGILLTLKYHNFFSSSLASFFTLFGVETHFVAIKLLLPIGISYYTLQALGYIIDVAQGKYEAERNPMKLMLFVCFFPQLFEGPIGRYNEMKDELTLGAPVASENVLRGWLDVIWGFFKIMIISNRLGIVTGEIFKNYTLYGGFTIIFAMLAFTIQLYAEFSGYINLASGISKMYGIHLKKNFDLPFLATNVPDFWRRWHISLGAWFRDYLFYPIAASNFSLKIQSKDTRASKVLGMLMTILTLFVIWFLTGLWHGASALYILYGIYYFVLMTSFELTEPLFDRLWKALKIEGKPIVKIFGVVKTLVFVNIGMLLFRATSPQAFGHMFGSIFTSANIWFDLFAFIDRKDFVILIVGLAVLLISGIVGAKKISVPDHIVALPYVAKTAILIAVVVFIIIFGAYGYGYIPPDPIYGGF
ncbi:MAG: hypothetical protein RSB10_03240 [Clostridia bacterium]